MRKFGGLPLPGMRSCVGSTTEQGRTKTREFVSGLLCLPPSIEYFAVITIVLLDIVVGIGVNAVRFISSACKNPSIGPQ